MIKKIWPIGIALGVFFLYLHTLGPTLVPYRDGGEMAASVTTLGILHPTSYPVYSLVGHLFTRLPLANPAYRLNLLSALALVGAWALLFLLLRQSCGNLCAVLAVLMGALSFQFWAHALISEMYTLNLLFIALVLLLLNRKQPLLAALAFGVGMANRMDMVLCSPAFLILYFGTEDRLESRRLLIASAIFVLGFSVYFYLPLRAAQRPFLNWSDPSTASRFFNSLVRRSYGGTLDLLSKSYEPGENFWAEFALYLKHVWLDFAYLGIPLAVGGAIVLFRKSPVWFWTVFTGWAITGPVFIFLGNLPPNPHAVAIMEAAYLVPDLFLLIAIAAAFGWLRQRPKVFIPVCAVVLVGIALEFARSERQVDSRHNWIGTDFIANTYKTVPEPAMIVGRSDVPIFSLFYGHWVYPKTTWRIPIAQGLAASAWYQVIMGEQTRGLQIGPLVTADDWEALAKANPGWGLYGMPDTDWSPELLARTASYGLLMKWLPRGPNTLISSDTMLQDLYVYRGRYRYNAYRQYFSPELIEEYAKAWMEWGRLLSRSNQNDSAAEAFLHALNLKPDMPYPAFQLGYLYFAQGKFVEAEYYYHWAVDNFMRMDADARQWKTLPATVTSLRADAAQAIAQWGVAHERLGHPGRAIELYNVALRFDPNSADARYNLAVMYWRQKQWADVVDNLQALAQAHPEDPRWKAYLPAAMQHLKGS